MGRHRTYKTPEDAVAARRASSMRYYEANRDAVLKRRKERKKEREALSARAIKTYPPTLNPAGANGVRDFADVQEEIHKFASAWMNNSLPWILTEEIMSARRRAPLPYRIEESCHYWKMVLTKFVRGEIFSRPNPNLDSGPRLGSGKGVSDAILQDLLSTCNRDAATLFEYAKLEIYLEKTEDSVYDVLRHAREEKLLHPDSSESDKLCETAEELGDFMGRIFDVIREMIVLRRDGVEALLKAAATGNLRTLEELV